MSDKTRRLRRAAGVCVYCGGELDNKKRIYCTKCLKKTQERSHYRREHGLCVQCGAPVQDTYYCRKCADIRAVHYYEKISGKGAAVVTRTYSPGMVRRLDDLGRVCIPIEVRRIAGIEQKHDMVEMFVKGDALIFKKYEPTCVFCGGAEVNINYKGKNICDLCITELKILNSLR